MKIPKWLLVVPIVALAVGLAIGQELAKKTVVAQEINTQNRHSLLAKRLFVEDPNDTIVNFTALRTSLRKRFADIKQPYSFYFEYLPTGTSIRIDGESQLVAASLVKLPVVMNLYRASELKRIDLDQSIRLTEDDIDGSYGDLYLKGPGTAITLRQAARLALAESDNTASRAINRMVFDKLNFNEDSLPWLDIDYNIKGGEAVMSAREYASILKCLYLSCYLSKDSSNEILSYLSASNFGERLTKHIPKNTQVAHKIGVNIPLNIHSDCGIFYVPNRPYLVCVMMEGEDEVVSEYMANISKEIYERISNE